MVAAKGSTVHLARSTPTTSMCATRMSAREGSATAELRRRATTEVRPGATGSSSAAMPSFCRIAKRYFAAACSFPGGLVVLILIRSWSQTLASPVSEVRSPSGDWLPGRQFVGGGATCAATGCATTSCTTTDNAATNNHASTCSSGRGILRKPFTKPSSFLVHSPPRESGERPAVAEGYAQQRFAANLTHINMQGVGTRPGNGTSFRKLHGEGRLDLERC